MGVMLQAAYRRKVKFHDGLSVPSPFDGDKTIPWWWDHLASQANDWRNAGFTAVLIPPVWKTNAGAFPGADGYGPFDDYDIGSKDQFFAMPTRFGTREQLQRMAAIFRANGIDLYLDIVPHHRNGDPGDGWFKYKGANNVKDVGRFPKHPECFMPWVPRDPIAGPIADDFSFGRQLCPINGKPKDYVMNGLIDAGDWLFKALDAKGMRIDDTKGLAIEFVKRYLTSKAMADKFAFGEYYDGNVDTLNWWCWNSGINGRAGTFDFATRFRLRDMCNAGSNWDMRQLQGLGLAGRSPAQAVTFLDNHDTDLTFPAIWNKMLGYCYILTAEGYPCVYYKDYSTDDGCYGLKPYIDNLVWIHEHLANGQTATRFADYQAYVFERTGWPNLLVGMNNDMYNGWRLVTVQTNFGANVELHDYTGHANNVWTDWQGKATIGIPPNHDGMGYVCYSRVGLDKANEVPRWATTQVFEGAFDLDIPPLTNDQDVPIRVWCAAGFPIKFNLRVNPHGWTSDSEVRLTVTDPSGAIVARKIFDPMGNVGLPQKRTAHMVPDVAVNLDLVAKKDGWHKLSLLASNLPVEAHDAFRLTATYTAPQRL